MLPRLSAATAQTSRARALALLLALALTPAAALAQRAAAPRLGPVYEESWLDGLRLSFVVEGTPGVDYGDGEVSWVRTTGRASLQAPLSERWGVGASFAAESLSSRVDAEPSFLAAGGEPLRELFESTFSMGVRRRIGERFALGAGGYLSAKLEPGADLGDSLKGGAAFTFAYRRSETLDLTAGVKLGSRFDRPGLAVRPVLGLEWNITPQLELELDNTNLRLAYTVWDGVELLVFGGMEGDRYRLEQRSAGSLANDAGTLRYRSATVGLGFRWFVTGHLRVSATAGVLVWQELEVSDASGHDIASREMEGVAPVIALRLQGRF